MSANQIRRLKELDFVKELRNLASLDLCYNPCQKIKYYFQIVVYKLSQLRTLDGNNLTEKDFVKASIFYGGDVETKRETFNANLPDEEFIDRRIFTSHMLDPDSDTEPAEYDFFDKYDEEGNRIDMPPSYLPKQTAYPFGSGKTAVEKMTTVVNMEFVSESVQYMKDKITEYLKEQYDTKKRENEETNQRLDSQHRQTYS